MDLALSGYDGSDTSFLSTNIISIAGDNLDSLELTADADGNDYPEDGAGLAGIDSGLYTLDGNSIFLYINSDGIVVGREGIGGVADPGGDIVLAVYLEEDPASTPELREGRVWTVLFEPLLHPDGTDDDDAVNLAKYSSPRPTPFNSMSALPPPARACSSCSAR